MNVEVKTLSEMTAQEWCKLAEERIKVFVVEQECPYTRKSMNRIINSPFNVKGRARRISGLYANYG